MSKLSILMEFWDFLRVRKKWWLAPIIIFLLLFGTLIVLTEGSALAPFIYVLFYFVSFLLVIKIHLNYVYVSFD